MIAKGLNPILNVSSVVESFAWFEKFGWRQGFDWGSPPTFGSVCSGKFEIDQMEAVRNDKPDRTRQLLGDVLQAQPDQIAQLQSAHHRRAHRHGTGPDAVFLVVGQIDQLPHPGQRVRQA